MDFIGYPVGGEKPHWLVITVDQQGCVIKSVAVIVHVASGVHKSPVNGLRKDQVPILQQRWGIFLNANLQLFLVMALFVKNTGS